MSVLLLAGSAFAFPHDPNPGSIDETGGWGSGSYRFNGFTGNYSNTLRSLGVDALRVLEFMNQEFLTTNGPGAPNDMQIWDTPSFASDKLAQDRVTWKYLMEHPGAAVPASIGYSMYTTHDELIAYIESLPKTNLTIEYVGEIPRGFPFPFMVFSTSPDHSPEGLRASGKPTIWVQGNIHGGEWSTGEGAIAMAGSLAKGKYDHLLQNVNVIIVPRVCADGSKRPIRTTDDLIALQWTTTPDARDLNRDNMLLDLPVTRALKKMINAYKPHVSVDLHERGSTSIATIFGRKFDTDAGDVGLASPSIQDATVELTRIRYEVTEPVIARVAQEHSIAQGFYGENPDVYTHGNQSQFASVASWLQTWTANSHTVVYNQGHWSADELTKIAPHATAGYSSNMITNTEYDPDAPYRLRSDASFNTRASRNINALMGTVSQLFENKSGPTNVGNRGMWERRVATGYISILGTITAAAEKSEWLVNHIGAMRDRWIEQGKTVSTADMIPVLQLTPKPYFWNEGEPKIGYAGNDIPYRAIDITGLPTNINDLSIADGVAQTIGYDVTKALKYVGPGLGNPATKNGAFEVVTDESGKRGDGTLETAEMLKFTRNWLGSPLRERIRPYAYIMDGPYAEELATRMALNGIVIKRLSEDMDIAVEGWSYNQVPYVDNAVSGGGGWRNRDVRFFSKTKNFKKDDTYVIYLGQIAINLIPMYMEPDAVYNAAACVMLPYMSLALGGAGVGSLHPDLKDMEMPMYRYLLEEDLPTYDMNVELPLVNRGAVPRFFNFPTQDEVKVVADKVKQSAIKVYNYDVQVHTRTDALVDGKIDITLPTNADTKSYMVMKKDGTYEALVPHSNMLGYNVATLVIAEHGVLPFTVDLDQDGRPVVGDGADRTLPRGLPPQDDLIGVQIIEVLADSNKVIEASAQAVAMMLPGSPRLTITVTEVLYDGSKNNITLTTAGSAGVATYSVGPYSISVNAQGALGMIVIVPAQIVDYSGDGYKYN